MEESLQGDSEHVQNIIIGLEERDGKPDVHSSESVSLWTSGDAQLGHFEVLQDGIKVKSPTSPSEDPSLAGHEIGENSNDQILQIKHELTEGTDLKQTDEQVSPDSEESSMLPGDEMGEGDMLQDVHGEVATILDDGSGTIPASSDLTHSTHDVIQMLLPSGDESVQNGEDGELHSLKTISSGDLFTPPTQTIQAITLADGNTAFIQHSGSSKFLEGQTITLEDGTTAVVQPMPDKFNLMTSINEQNIVTSDTTSSTNIQLQDTTSGFLNQAVKDGLQAIILEDGTTAYLATQQTPGGAGLIDSSQLEASTLTLDQLTSTIGSSGVLPNGMANVDMKTLPTSMPSGSEVTVSHEKETVVMGQFADKVGPFLEKAYKCGFEGCGKYYTTLHHLKVHERAHTGDRPFKCDFKDCGKAFATGYGLKSHTRVHTGEKPYKCQDEGCQKAFKTSGDLQKHMRTHTGERPFKCPFEGCTRSFTTSNIRKVHIRTHTGERPYLCTEEGCGRAFASATNYKNHIRIHTGEKPYVCTVMGCGKRFTEYSSLYKHHVVHTHAKPYSCSRCGKTYRQTSTLAMHKRTAHGEDVTAESEALLFQDQAQGDILEPSGKRMRLSLINQDSMIDEGEGTLVINTPDVSQQLAYIGTDGLTSSADLLQSPLGGQGTLFQHGVTLTVTDQGQQVFVITDPAQLEALQQIAKHQMETEGDMEPLLSTTLTSEIPQNTENVTIVTEINTDSGLKDNSAVITNITENDVMNQ